MRAAMKMLAVIFLAMLTMTATFVEEVSATGGGKCCEWQLLIYLMLYNCNSNFIVVVGLIRLLILSLQCHVMCVTGDLHVTIMIRLFCCSLLRNQCQRYKCVYKKLSYHRETAPPAHQLSFSARSLIVYFTKHRTCCTTMAEVGLHCVR